MLNNNEINGSNKEKLLGILLDSKRNFESRIGPFLRKADQKNNCPSQTKKLPYSDQRNLLRPAEMKNILRCYQLWNIVGQHGWPTRNIFISSRLKRLEKLTICRRQVIYISIINRYLLRNYLESVLKVFTLLWSFEVWSLGLMSWMFLIVKVNLPTDSRLF